jgi:hypothetical protein
MLAWAQKGLDPTGGPSLRHSMSVERVKALRWLTEPWWPELALTPWRDQGTGFESIMSPEAFDEKRRAALDDLSRA